MDPSVELRRVLACRRLNGLSDQSGKMQIRQLHNVAYLLLLTSTVAFGKRNFQPNEPVKLYANKVGPSHLLQHAAAVALG